MPKSYNLKITLVRKGRRIVGELHKLPSGEDLYLAYRKTVDISANGARCISDAVRDGTATWGIDEEIVIQMRVKKIRYIGIHQRDTGDVWLTTMNALMDRTISKVRSNERRRSLVERHLPLQYFRKRRVHIPT